MTTESRGQRLEARQWSIGWDGERLLGPLDFTVSRGERVAVTGPSGCGKSTLIRSLAGLVDPMGGKLTLDGQTPETFGWPSFRIQVHYLAQRGALGQMTVENILKRPFTFSSQSATYQRESAIAALAEVGLASEVLERPATQLSEGQQQRVGLVRSLLIEPSFLLLDEPTSALDVESASLVEGVITRRCSGGHMGAVWITHDHAQAARIGDRLVAFSGEG